MTSDDIPSLGVLIRQYNALLGWSQVDLARACGMSDPAPLNRIVRGKILKPHETTLQTIVEAYQAAGLTGVTVEELVAARDRPARGEETPFGFPAQWVRLIRSVLAQGEEVQDSLFRKWSLDLQETSRLLASRGARSDPEGQLFEDD